MYIIKLHPKDIADTAELSKVIHHRSHTGASPLVCQQKIHNITSPHPKTWLSTISTIHFQKYISPSRLQLKVTHLPLGTTLTFASSSAPGCSGLLLLCWTCIWAQGKPKPGVSTGFVWNFWRSRGTILCHGGPRTSVGTRTNDKGGSVQVRE